MINLTVCGLHTHCCHTLNSVCYVISEDIVSLE